MFPFVLVLQQGAAARRRTGQWSRETDVGLRSTDEEEYRRMGHKGDKGIRGEREVKACVSRCGREGGTGKRLP